MRSHLCGEINETMDGLAVTLCGYQRAMRRLVVMTIAFIAGLVAFAPDLLEPYRSVEGQLWLLIPVGMWAGCLVWLRRITSYADEPRYRLQLSKVVT